MRVSWAGTSWIPTHITHVLTPGQTFTVTGMFLYFLFYIPVAFNTLKIWWLEDVHKSPDFDAKALSSSVCHTQFSVSLWNRRWGPCLAHPLESSKQGTAIFLFIQGPFYAFWWSGYSLGVMRWYAHSWEDSCYGGLGYSSRCTMEFIPWDWQIIIHPKHEVQAENLKAAAR